MSLFSLLDAGRVALEEEERARIAREANRKAHLGALLLRSLPSDTWIDLNADFGAAQFVAYRDCVELPVMIGSRRILFTTDQHGVRVAFEGLNETLSFPYNTPDVSRVAFAKMLYKCAQVGKKEA